MTDLPAPDFESMSVEAIRKRVEFAVRPFACSSGPLADTILRRDVPWLLAEVERLRAERGPDCPRCEVGRAEPAGCDLREGCVARVKPYHDEVQRLRGEAAELWTRLHAQECGYCESGRAQLCRHGANPYAGPAR